MQQNKKITDTNIIKNFKKKYEKCSTRGQLNHVSTQSFQDSRPVVKVSRNGPVRRSGKRFAAGTPYR